MSIEDDVSAAIEEFGNDAYKRFYYRCFGLTVGCESNAKMNIMNDVFLKPLSELFSHDVSVYGDNAYLMWEWQYKDNGSPIWVDVWHSCDRPLAFKESLNYRRKNSAALPFDIERAVRGDVVEGLHNGAWCIKNSQDVYSKFRMKYPPKVQS